MNKILGSIESKITDSVAKKLTSVSVTRGGTAWPKSQKDQENVGIRFDYDGEVNENGVTYNKFQVQPNAGKVPSTIAQWSKENGGTHAVMGSMYVKKGGSQSDAKTAYQGFREAFKG